MDFDNEVTTPKTPSSSWSDQITGKLKKWGAKLAKRYVKVPEVTLLEVKIREANLLEQRFRIHLRIHNPNPLSVPIKLVRYRVELLNERFAKGETVESFRIPARGSTDLELDVKTSTLRLGRSLLNLLMRPGGGVDYRISGDVELGWGWAPVLPFSHGGNVDILK